jgi:glycosyltransferase involved in cell wall biosynthesis
LIPKLIKKLKPDVVIEPCHIGPFGLPRGIKRVTIIHDLTPVLFPKFHIPKSVLVHRLFLKSIIKNADLIITPSQNTKNDILNYCSTKAEIAVIPEGVNHLKLSQEPRKTLAKFGIKKPFLLFLGTIEPRKNLNVLIQAFTELKKEHNISHQLILAGGLGWKVEKTLEEAKKHKDIILTDFISEDEKSALYQECDIFVYPSLYEGFGLPPLEAMSFGKPTIISTGGALKEIPESAALHFPPEDKNKLKLLILKLINDPSAKTALSEKALIFAKNFTWSKTAETLLTFLCKVVKSFSGR